MIHLALRFACVALLIALTSFGKGKVCEATPFDIRIYQTPTPAGDLSYELKIVSFSVFMNRGTVVAPNGRIFDNFFKSQYGSSAYDLSFSELQTLITGNWVINDRFSLPFEPVPTNPSEQHTFSISPIEPADLFTETSTTISPTADSVVPPTFYVNWQWPVGTVPPSQATWRVGGAGGGVDFLQLGPTSSRFTIGFEPGESTDDIRVYVGSSESLEDFISDITPVSANVSRHFEPKIIFSSLSAPLPLTVVKVPEPATVSLATLLCTIAILLRSAKEHS